MKNIKLHSEQLEDIHQQLDECPLDVTIMIEDLDYEVQRIGKIERILFLGFFASFFYLRLGVFTRVMLWCGYEEVGDQKDGQEIQNVLQVL